MTWSQKCCVLILGATVVAAALRLPRLAQRPMHGDEAIHAVKFGRLLVEGFYGYDPHDYHGPTLNYLSLVPAWFSSAKTLTEVTEFTLRIVPVFFGVLLVLLPLMARDGLGGTSAIWAAVLTAVSAAMVFYSRYYIMEILLVCFTFAAIVCGYRYVRSRHIVWALLTGAFLGLMHATKETCIIAFGSMLLAVLLVLLTLRSDTRLFALNNVKAIKPWHLVAGLAVAAAVSALFYSSFLSNPRGILDSFRTYATYLGRAGKNPLHIHPWYYYLNMLLYSRYGGGPAWIEALIILLAVAGFIVAVSGKSLPTADRHLLRFIAFYTLIMTVVYSAIPYKTPWCILGFLHGMILLAGVGAAAIIKSAPHVLARTIIIVLLLAGGSHLAWQAYLANYVYYADSRNPYVYAHPTTEVFTVTKGVEEMAQVHPDGRDIHIQVICPGRDYWPLPWYLRSFPRVGWYGDVPADTSLFSVGLECQSGLDSSVISRELQQEFRENGMPLSPGATVSVGQAGGRWLITDELNRYSVRKENSSLNIYLPPAPVIIASPSVEGALIKKLYEKTPLQERQMYMYLFDEPYYVWLRPEVKLLGLVRKDLWERFERRQGQSIAPRIER